MVKSALTFPYLYKRIEFGKVFNPLISLPVKSRWGWQPLWFLVDSGADTTMLTLSLATNLGLVVNRNEKTQLFGIGEKSVPAYPGNVVLQFGISEKPVRAYFVDASESTLLLGRLDVFDKYTIVFDASSHEVKFHSLK